MCKPGNQTIFRDCMVKFKSMNGGHVPTTKERKRLLLEHGGCLTSKEVYDTTISK